MVRSAFHASAFLLFLCPTFLCAQSEPPQHPPRPKVVGPAKWNPAPQEVSAAYWTLEPGWNTNLEMRNNLRSRELTITPVLRAATGQELALAPVTVAAQHVVALDLRKLAQANPKILSYLGSFGFFGSAVFRFDGLYPDNLFAATIVRREGEPIDFHFDGQENGPTYNSGGIEGMWWLPAASSTDYLILSNPLKKIVRGTLTLTSPFASHRPVALSLDPGETKRINLGEVLGSSSIGAVGGLSLSLPGKELISATQIVFDEVTGLAAMMKIFDREPDDQPKSRVLLAPMMALRQPDQGLGFPNGTQLLPRIFLRNAGPAPTQILATVDWRNQSSGTFAFPALTLSPGEIKTISLADYQQAGQIPPDASWGTLKLAYTGRRADLVAVAVSYDKANRYGLQTPFSEDLSRMWAGGMWHVDPTHNTFITTGNGGAEATTAEVTLFYNGGTSKYRMEKMLSPGQQLWLDVGRLVHDQIPDSDGHTLPPDTMTGSYELRDLDHAYVGQLYEGKLVIDKTYGHAAYGCGSCCGYAAVVLDPDPFLDAVGLDYQDSIYANDTCAGDREDVTGDGYSWASSDTAVATLSSRTLHTVAPGSATGSTLVKLQFAHPPQCPITVFGPQQPVSVTNNTPILTGIDPSDWASGATTPSVTFTGQYFGTNAPTLSFSPSSGISYSLVSYNDTQIVANIAVRSGTPTEAVDVSVTNNGYGGVGFQSGGGSVSPTSAPVYATVRAPLNSPEITVIAWVNPAAPDLVTLPTGENSTLQGNLQNGTTSQQVSCAAQVFAWTVGSRLNLSSSADESYANAWLVKNSANTAPPSTITPSVELAGGNYRLINDFGNGKSFVNVGSTPDPCKTGLLGWAGAGQPSQYEGYSSTSPAGEVYQIAEGRIGTVGQLGSETINGGRTVPWIWSAIEFNSANGTPNYDPPLGMFPTYYLYVNGTLTYTFAQSTVAAFVAKDETYQLTPSQIP